MLFFVYNIRGALTKYLRRKLKYYSVIFKNNMDSFQLLKRRPSTYNKLQQSTFRWMSSTFYERSNKLCSYRWRNWYETHTKQLRHQINSFMLYSQVHFLFGSQKLTSAPLLSMVSRQDNGFCLLEGPWLANDKFVY